MKLLVVYISQPLRMRPLKNAPFCPIPASGSNFNPPPNFGGLILKILNVFLWLKFSPFLVLNKIERFSKVSKCKAVSLRMPTIRSE